MRFAWPRIFGPLVAAAVVAEAIVIAPASTALLLLAGGAWMAAPGIPLVAAVLRVRVFSAHAGWLLGPAIGLGFSVVGTLVFWVAGVQNGLAIVAGPGLTWLLAWVFRRAGGMRLRVPALDRRDLAAAAIALAIVPAMTWAPYDHVREPQPDGEAYRAYFTADFVWAMTVTAEVAKGDVPPANPYLYGGETLHYYWLAHFLSGALYRNVAGWGATAEQVVLIDGLAFGLAFVAFFYGLARISGASAGFASLAVVLGFAANSYEGLDRLWVLTQQGVPLAALRDYNIDAVTRWFYQGMPVDGLQRLLLYQPHHLTGYVMALTALWIAACAEDVRDISAPLSSGTLLGLAFLFSTFTAVILSAAIGLVYAIRLIERRAWRSFVTSAILGGGPAAVGAMLTSVLGYTDPRAGVLIQVGLNPVATLDWPWMLLLSFGPLLLFGVAGLFRLSWIAGQGLPAAALVLAAISFYFLTDVPDMNGVWVGWRSGHQLLIGFCIIAAAALTAAWRMRIARTPIVLALVVLCVPAIPTAAIDIYNAQDVSNRNPGPTFPWTLVITPSERESLEWLKRATPPHAVVQFEPVARGFTYWALLTAFAERRMAAGLPIAMVPLRRYQEASETVRLGIFQASSAKDAHAIATALGVDYVFVGDVERRLYLAAVEAMAADPTLFQQAFTNDAATIYAVVR